MRISDWSSDVCLGNWTVLFRAGEKLRLRFINGSAMTYFDVRIPGLKMTVVAADGQYVHPVTVDEFRIATAETFDVIVEPTGQDAFTIFAQDSGRTGYISGTLAVREGLRAPVRNVDPKPLLTMDDMGHGGMGGGGHDMSSMSHDAMAGGAMAGMDHSGHDMSSMAGGAMAGGRMAGMDHGGGGMQDHSASETGNPLVDIQTMAPAQIGRAWVESRVWQSV